MGLSTTFLHADLTFAGEPVVSAQSQKKRKHREARACANTPARDRCVRGEQTPDVTCLGVQNERRDQESRGLRGWCVHAPCEAVKTSCARDARCTLVMCVPSHLGTHFFGSVQSVRFLLPPKQSRLRVWKYSKECVFSCLSL